MPLDPNARRFLDRLAALQPTDPLQLSPLQRRDALAELLRFAGRPPAIGEVREGSLQGPAGALPLRSYAPQAAPEIAPGLIFLHGGGLVAGSLDTHDTICRHLCAATACRIVSIGYRLAPEHRFPAALEDAEAAVRLITGNPRAHGIEPARCGLAGDSAGATLAAVVAQRAAATGTPLGLQLLLCPILDFGAETPSRREFARGYFLEAATLAHDLKYYLPETTDPADPRISPLRAGSLRGLPRTLIHTAEFDPLRDEGRAYAERLAGEGVHSTYTCHPGMIHLFYGLTALIPAALGAWQVIGADVRRAFGLVS